MAAIKNVVVAGASGSVGKALVQALLDADFSVTALSRADGTKNFPSAVKIVKVDYNDEVSLRAALTGQDAVISALNGSAGGEQEKLLDAAVAVGVKRYIPSEFGSDTTNAKSKQLPVYGSKIKFVKYMQEKTRGTDTTYTVVLNNIFLDFDLDVEFFVTNIKEKKIEIFDGGDLKYTATPLPFVGKGVVSILQHPEETANRYIRLNGATLTQNKYLEILQRVTGKEEWQVTRTNTAELEKRSYENLKEDPKNVHGWAIGFIKRAIFAEGYGGDFSEKNDNELLGLNELSEQQVEDIVRSRA